MRIFLGNKFTYIAVFTANMSGFICGTALSWTSPIIPKLTSDNPDDIPWGEKIDSEEESWIASFSPLGGIFGPLIFAFLLEKLGRKYSVLGSTLPLLIAYVITSFAQSVYLYYIARFLMGIGIGAVFTVLPVYVVECTAKNNRGILTASQTIFIIFGILFSYVLGPYVSIMAFNLTLVVICIAFIPVFLYVSPETPIYLLRNDKDFQAKDVLRYLRRENDESLDNELAEIKGHLKDLQQGSYLDLFKTKASRKALLISIILTSLQQLSGINVILAYTQNIFVASGTKIAPEVCSIIVGVVQFITSFISPLLADRLGRKILLGIASTGSCISQIILGCYFYFTEDPNKEEFWFWLPIASLVGYILFYNFGVSSLPWTMMVELLPSNVVSVGSSLTTSIYWLSGFFLTKYFGSVSDDIGMGPSFWIFSAFCLILTLFNLLFLFETKGKSLKEIQELLAA